MALLTFSVCMCGYHENSAKILPSFQRCWLISGHCLHHLMSSFRLHTTFRLLWIHVLEPTDQPHILGLNVWLSTPESHSWLPNILLPFFWSRSLCDLRTKIDKERSSRHSSTTSKIPEIITLPTHNIQKPIHTHIYIYIYIYIYMNAHYCATLLLIISLRSWLPEKKLVLLYGLSLQNKSI